MAKARKMDRNLLHIEAEGAVINIREGLTDVKGRKVTSVSIIPDDHFQGEPIWKVSGRGCRNIRIIKLKQRYGQSKRFKCEGRGGRWIHGKCIMPEVK